MDFAQILCLSRGIQKEPSPCKKEEGEEEKGELGNIFLLTSLFYTCTCAFQLLVQLSYENWTGPIMVPESICLGYRVSLRSVLLDTEYSDLWESLPMYMHTPASRCQSSFHLMNLRYQLRTFCICVSSRGPLS